MINMWSTLCENCSMKSISSSKSSIPSVQVTDDSHNFWSKPSTWFFYRGIHFMKHFDVISKQKAVWIPDHTRQLVYENVEKVWYQNWSLWYTRQHFMWCTKRSTKTDMKYYGGNVTTSKDFVSSRQPVAFSVRRSRSCRIGSDSMPKSKCHQTVSESKLV
jgi:hypothetical protein